MFHPAHLKGAVCSLHFLLNIALTKFSLGLRVNWVVFMGQVIYSYHGSFVLPKPMKTLKELKSSSFLWLSYVLFNSSIDAK